VFSVAILQEFLKVPKQRIAVIIGPNGKTKKAIEKKTNCRIEVDSEEGEVEVTSKPQNAASFYIALNMIKAIGRGFSPERAFLLTEHNNGLEIIDITDWVKGSEKELATKRGRIIGKKGRAREEIEQKTGCCIAVQGKTVSIIGDFADLARARQAIEMLLKGARHQKVFDFLNRNKERESFEF
jgi:ribosomal RNA assembly protein